MNCKPARSLLLVLAAVLAIGHAKADVTPADLDAAGKIAGQICSNCHGPGGNSASPLFPNLAAQQPIYLAAQIRAFKNKTRQDPEAHNYMWGMATLISEPMADALARYYAAQPAAPPVTTDAALIAKGKQLFEQGVPDRGVVACANCHGAEAIGSSVFPRLAGQHKEYVIRQLQVIQKQLRASPIMHGIIKDLTPDEMTAVATYVQSK